MKLLVAIFTVVIFIGCSQKEHTLFQKNKLYKSSNNNQMLKKPYKIKPHDRLAITIFEYPELDKDLKRNTKGLEVSEDGTILLPLIGTIKVTGLTKQELTQNLLKKYSLYLEKAALKVEILNQKIYILGEVKKPGAFAYEQFSTPTPIQALVEAGGLTNYADRKHLFVIRGTRSDHVATKLDLTSLEDIRQNNIILEPQDIVYIPHNKMKDTTLELNGMEPGVNLINTIFNALTVYQVWK